MDQLESFSSNMISIFDGNNYVLWSNRMQTCLLAIGVDVWLFVVNGYKFSKAPPTDHDEKKTCSYNYKASHNLLNAFSTIVQYKVICCNSTKEV